MKKVLVTGGGGFIGQATSRELIKKGYSVKIFDIVKSNIQGVDDKYIGSILDPYELSEALRDCDFVIHLAASLGVRNTEKNRLDCLYINIQGTINVLEACVKQKIKKIVFSSSSEIYGEQKKIPIDEEAPQNPKSNYAISKLVGEEYTRAYCESYNLKYTICRLFNVYGEDQKNEFVFPIFINNVKNNNDINIFGDGKQIRSFCYVTDAAKGIVKCLKDKVSGEIFNIGNDKEPISINYLAKKMIKLSNKKINIKKINYSESDRKETREIFRRIPNINKARKLLNFEPSISLDEGLKKMLL